MRYGQASAFSSNQPNNIDVDLERRAEEAARQAGKSVEEWLHDLILEQSSGTPSHQDFFSTPSGQDSTKQSVLANLAHRVNGLEKNIPYSETPQNRMPLDRAIHDQATQINQRYDANARALIDNIKARAHAAQHSQHPAPAMHINPPSTDHTSDHVNTQLNDMLATIANLERRLEQTQTSPNPGKEMAASHVAPPADESTERLIRLEQKLGELQSHLTSAAPQYGNNLASNAPQAHHSKPVTTRSKKRNSPLQGRRALRQAMDQIADREGGQASSDISYVPKNRPARASIGRRDADRQISDLAKKIDGFINNQASAKDIQNLNQALEELKRNLLGSETSAAFTELTRLRTAIEEVQSNVAQVMDDNRLSHLEKDINRIAEFLLKSPDLQHVPEKTDTIAREISRISDGLLAVTEKNQDQASKSSQQIVTSLEGTLRDLRDDIVLQINNPSSDQSDSKTAKSFEDRLNTLRDHIDTMAERTNAQVAENNDATTRRLENSLRKTKRDILKHITDNTPKPTPAPDVSGALDRGISELKKHIDSSADTLSNRIDTVENRVETATEKLEQLGNLRHGSPEVSQKMAEMEERMVEAARRLEKASLEAAKAQSDTGSPVLSVPLDTVTKETLREEIGALSEKFDKTLEEFKSSTNQLDPAFEAQMAEMEKRLIEATDRLETAANENRLTQHESDPQQAELPEDAVSKSHLNVELNDLAERLTNSFIANRALPQTPSLTMDDVREELKSLASQMQNGMASERVQMISHIDAAMGKLHQMAAQQASQQQAAPHEEITNIQNGFHDLKRSTDSLSQETRASFDSVRDMLSNVTSRLTELESGGRPGEQRGEPNNYDQSSSVAQTTRDDAVPLSEDQKIIERMRSHVKAREPDAPLLEPSADDIPLEPGAGKPDFQPKNTSQQPLETHYAEGDEQPVDPPSFGRFHDEQPQEDVKTKKDFLLAARRAAQDASHEQMQLEEETKQEAEQTKSSFKTIRDRFGAVTKRRSQKKSEEAASIPEVNPPQSDPVIDGESSSNTTAFDEELVDEKSRSSSKRPLLTVGLVCALAVSSYFVLSEPLSTLVNNLTSPSDKATETAAAPKAPAVPLPPKVAPVLSENQGTTSLIDPGQNSASTVENTNEDLQTSILDGTAALDTNTTEAINPSGLHFDTPTATPTLDPALARAIDGLPRKGVSDKLAAAALLQDPSAFFELGRRYGQGEVFPRDPQKAAFWYEQAAKRGHTISQFRIGSIYEEGIGVARNVKRAHKWYLSAAEAGNARAMHNLAVLNTEGALGEPDFNEAFEWFLKGANLGIKDSQFNLGILYVRGLGVKANLVEAYKWFDIVARAGDVDASDKRDDIAKAITENQLRTAKAKSLRWEKQEWLSTANVISPSPLFWRDGTETVKTNTSLPVKAAKSPLVEQAQHLLNGLGFDAGETDGLLGNQTKKAIRSFEFELGLPQTGKVNQQLIDLLRAQHS